MFSLTKNSGILSCRRSFPKDLMRFIPAQAEAERVGSGSGYRWGRGPQRRHAARHSRPRRSRAGRFSISAKIKAVCGFVLANGAARRRGV